MAAWNSLTLEVVYQLLGWIAFFSWSISFYPQVLLNYRRKSVVGLNFDFLVMNMTKHSSYLVYNAALYFSPVIQRQYHEKYGFDEYKSVIDIDVGTVHEKFSTQHYPTDELIYITNGRQMIPVAANDVAFSIHAVLLTAFTIFQVFIYERGSQKVSKTCTAITSIVWASVLVCVIVSWPKHSWLWLINVFNTVQVVMTAIKYIPQALMNFGRKSTVGWSIGNILLDLLGGLLNFGQMAVQSIDQGSWTNFYGNIGKTLLSLEVVFFDILFIIQHYVLYPSKEEKSSPLIQEEVTTPFMAKSSEPSPSSNV